MTKLTTHVLDVYSGKPGKGIKVELYLIKNNKREKLNTTILNSDGRADKPLIEGSNFKEGQYEIIFFVGEYFKKITETPNIPFLDDVVVNLEFLMLRSITMYLCLFHLGAIQLIGEVSDCQHHRIYF